LSVNFSHIATLKLIREYSATQKHTLVHRQVQLI